MATAQAIDVRYVNPFIASAVNAIETLTGVKPQRGTPYVKKAGDDRLYDVSGAIGLSGQITGLVATYFTRDVICPLVGRMLGQQISQINDMVCDAVGEIANITAGTAKERTGELPLAFRISLPMVIKGRFQSHSFPVGVPCIVVPFKTEHGEFAIEIAVKVENGESPVKDEQTPDPPADPASP